MTERRDFGPQFARIPIITANDGTQVLLGDIAEVEDGFEDTDTFATYNGERCILIDVYRVGEQTPLEVSDAVRANMAVIRPDLPPGVHLVPRNDRSDIYRQRMDLMLRNGYFGLAWCSSCWQFFSSRAWPSGSAWAFPSRFSVHSFSCPPPG